MLFYYSWSTKTLVNRNFKVITTMNKAGYEKYGRKMIDSWHRYWPHYMYLDVYVEGFELPEKNWAGINELDLVELNPELAEFKERHSNRPDQQNPQELAHGAVRFSHKSFAVIHACLNNPDTVIIWLDADTVTHNVVTSQFLEDLLPEEAYTSYLGRQNNYTECGFVMYDTSNPFNEQFMMMWKSLYVSDQIFELPQWHDCMAYDAVRAHLEQKGMRTYNITPDGKNYDHVFINSPLGTVMDHLKGPRKDAGKSSLNDLYGSRTIENSWSYFKN